MTMRLLVFSLLTKMSPVPLAWDCAGSISAATIRAKTSIRACMGEDHSLRCRQPTLHLRERARQAPGTWMDEQTREQEAASALLLDDVVKTYGAVRAVDGVSLAVRAGEFIALLGPNGAGKSTLFQLLSGLFAADSGRIVVMGHDMSRDPVPALAELGIVFQQPTLDLELS